MPLNILVADDSATMRRIMELTFAGEDARVVAVPGGEAAVAKAQEIRPDVVFADASMGGMDGYAVASAIKSTAGLEQTAVIVMASQKHPYDEGKGQGAGVDDHILKPFDTQHVIDRVNQVLSKPRAAVSAPMRTAPGAAPPPPPAPPAAPPAPSSMPQMSRPPGGGARPTAKGGTMVFEPKLTPAQPQPAVPAGRPAPVAAPAIAAATSSGGDLAQKLGGMGLSPAQVEGVLALSREVVEQVVWEVVPELAEALIKEEIRRLTAS